MRCEGDFPLDIAPLAQEINLLLTANRTILERARTQVGNLAHALKTPLAVIMNEFRDLPDAPVEKLAEQAAIMRDQISWHLDRARTAALTGSPAGATPVGPVIAEIARVFEKIHPARRLDIVADGGAGPAFSRRAAGFAGDGRQPPRQCGQMELRRCEDRGAPARRGDGRRAAAPRGHASMTTGRACPKRRAPR